jgi:hypothetical protein
VCGTTSARFCASKPLSATQRVLSVFTATLRSLRFRSYAESLGFVAAVEPAEERALLVVSCSSDSSFPQSKGVLLLAITTTTLKMNHSVSSEYQLASSSSC